MNDITSFHKYWSLIFYHYILSFFVLRQFAVECEVCIMLVVPNPLSLKKAPESDISPGPTLFLIVKEPSAFGSPKNLDFLCIHLIRFAVFAGFYHLQTHFHPTHESALLNNPVPVLLPNPSLGYEISFRFSDSSIPSGDTTLSCLPVGLHRFHRLISSPLLYIL